MDESWEKFSGVGNLIRYQPPPPYQEMWFMAMGALIAMNRREIVEAIEKKLNWPPKEIADNTGKESE